MSVSHMYNRMNELQGTSYSPNYMTALICNTCLGTLFFGYNLGVYNPIEHYLKTNIFPDTSPSTVNMIATLIPLGIAIGIPFAGYLPNKFGRFKALVISDVFSILSTLLTIFSSLWPLLIGRFLVGVSCGLHFALVPIYIGEFAPPKLKVKIGTAIAIFTFSGLLIAYLLGLNVPVDMQENTDSWWRTMLILPIIFNIIRIVNLYRTFSFETPYYYILQDQVIDASDVLSKLYPQEEVEAQLFRFTEEKERAQRQQSLSFRELIAVRNRKPLVVGCVLALASQFNGVMSFLFYSTSMFRTKREELSRAPHVYTIMIAVAGIIGAIGTNFTIEKYGRKAIMFWGEAIQGVLLAIMSIVLTVFPTSVSFEFLVLGFIFVFSLSFALTTWIYLAEILSDIGLLIAVGTSWVMSFLVGSFYPILTEKLGLDNSYLVFGIFCIVGAYFILERVLETKDKSDFQMHNLYHIVSKNGSIVIPKNAIL